MFVFNPSRSVLIIAGCAPPTARRRGYGLRAIKTAAQLAHERASTEALRSLVAVPRGAALYNTGAKTVARDANGLVVSMEAFGQVRLPERWKAISSSSSSSSSPSR